MRKRCLFGLSILLCWLLTIGVACAETLVQRVAAFPQWQSKPVVQRPTGDLFYPQWMAGEWRVESTLIDLVAPLAPDIVTPGFEQNRADLNRSIAFNVRFMEQPVVLRQPGSLKLIQANPKRAPIIADRAFNGLNIARAYLGDQIQAVKMDSHQPNRQIVLLRGDRQLVSTITGRAVETPAVDRLVTTEIFQQVFRGGSQPYLNQVETTTAYQLATPKAAIGKETAAASRAASAGTTEKTTPAITADQITAIYLSPQDPHYFRAQDTPVALYRYRLEFFPLALY
jgi:hypothetical protein